MTSTCPEWLQLVWKAVCYCSMVCVFHTSKGHRVAEMGGHALGETHPSGGPHTLCIYSLKIHVPPKPSALTCSSVALGRHCSVVGILEPAVGAAGKVVKVTVDAPPPPHPQHTHTPETANTSSNSLSVATMKSKGPASASGPDPELGLDPGTCPWPQVLTRSQALGALTQPQALIWD